MELDNIFDIFSKRNKKVEPYIYAVPRTLKNKIFMFCVDLLNNKFTEINYGDYTSEFWSEIHQALCYIHGRIQLVDANKYLLPETDTTAFLLQCKNEEFLDFIELIFKVKCLFHLVSDENILVTNLNKLLVSENVGYELTEIIKQKVTEPINYYPFHGQTGEIIRTISYPKIIKKENEVVHSEVIKPALQLLNDPKYITANQEYLEALEDYRKSDYGDCLTKACSAFESVMKIICSNKGWHYQQTDTATALISILKDKLKIEPYFEQTFIIIATLRNKLSKSHGAGVQSKVVSQNVARYSLNLTASAIIFLVNEAK
jgi:hypothetical protein